MLKKPFTIVLIYPDYIASNYGEEFWTSEVMADTVAEAQQIAQREAAEANQEDESDAFAVVFVCEGHHRNIMEN